MSDDDTTPSKHHAIIRLDEKSRVRTSITTLITIVSTAVAMTVAVVHLDMTVQTLTANQDALAKQISAIRSEVSQLRDVLNYQHLLPYDVSSGEPHKSKPSLSANNAQ